MKKIFLTLMMLVAATSTLFAQDELEQTAAPTVRFESGESYMLVTIENTDDCDAVVYYRLYKYPDGESFYEYSFTDYIFTFVVDGAGDYIIEVYAKAPDKLASETVTYGFFVPLNIITTPAYDFIVDGIYYKITRDSTVWVSPRAIEECTNDWDYQPHSADQSYSGDVIIPISVEYDGKTYPVTGIAAYAFEDCELSNVYLPNSIVSIGDKAFCDCTGLKVITLPESVANIEQNAFWWCIDLKSVICKATTPPSASGTAFWYNYNRATLFVPNESLEAYRTHRVWGKFTCIVPFIGAGPGDINGDGSIGISDATAIIDQLLSGDLPAYADVNGDGVVSILDVTTLIDMLLTGNN